MTSERRLLIRRISRWTQRLTGFVSSRCLALIRANRAAVCSSCRLMPQGLAFERRRRLLVVTMTVLFFLLQFLKMRLFLMNGNITCDEGDSRYFEGHVFLFFFLFFDS